MKKLYDIISGFDVQAFHFLRPAMLWLFIPLIIIVVFIVLNTREKKKWQNIVVPHLRPYMFSKGNTKALLLPLIFMLIGLTCMILALAGPTWKKRDIPGEKIPAVVLMALDLSKSMLAEDIQPSRLERAKMKISDFLDLNPRVRTGLIAYAGTPHIVLPFTSDYKLLKHHAGSLDNWEMPVQGTDITLALNLIDTLMSRVEAPSTILLMTDVIDDSDASKLSDFARNSIHRLEILLFSTPNGAPVPGNPGVVSKQSPAALSNLQQNEKINITTITLDKSDVEQIVDRISSHLVFEKDSKLDTKEWDDMGWLLLIPAIIIALLWFRKGWMIQWCWLFPLLSFGLTSCGVDSKHPDWWYSKNYQGELWYEKGEYEKAAELFADNAHKSAAYFKAGDYQSAAELLADDTTATGKFNYGLAMAKLGDYNEAIVSFQQAARSNPELQGKVTRSIEATQLLQEQADSVLRFHPHTSSVDSILKKTEKGSLKERKPTSEDEQLSSDTEVKKLPTSGDRITDETESNIHRGKEQKFPPKDFKMENQMPIETQILMQKTNADPGEFLHRRFEIQKNKNYPDVKQTKENW